MYILFHFEYDTIIPNFAKRFQNIEKSTSNFKIVVKKFVNIMNYREKLIYTGISRFKVGLSCLRKSFPN